MAKNWTLTEAIEALKAGDDKQARQDIAKRYPLLATASIDEIIAAIPEKISARMIESRLADDIDAVSDGDDADEDEKPAKKSMGGEMAAKAWSTLSQYEKKKARKQGAEFVAECKALDEEDDDEGEDEKPAKKAVKASKTKAKKPVEEDDDFDDFDEEDEDDDFDDDEKPAKTKKKSKPAVKSKKKKQPVEEDDDFDDDEDDDLDDF